MFKIMLVFGTRPEAIKMAPLYLELKKESKFDVKICVTGQHRQMLDQVMDIFKITPDYDLNIMKEKQSLTTITSSVLIGLDDVFTNEKPDLVLVHGDPTTTLSTSLAAFYHKIPIGHVEAGLRSFNKYSPFPEEINRKVTGIIAELHFAPTIKNKENLEREGINENIYITGNTVIDSMNYTISDDYSFNNELLKEIDFSKRTILVTAHRRENLGDPMVQICQSIKELALEYKDLQFVFPVHLNPLVRETVFSILDNINNIYLIDPIDVQDMHNTMNKSFFVLTDSGGLQEEAPALNKPVLVLRTETERPEAVETGAIKVVGVEKNNILKECKILLENKEEYEKMANSVNPYGDGKATKRISDSILKHFNL